MSEGTYTTIGTVTDVTNSFSSGILGSFLQSVTGDYSSISLTLLFYLFYYLELNYPPNLLAVYQRSKRPKQYFSEELSFVSLPDTPYEMKSDILPGRFAHFTNLAWNALYPFLFEFLIALFFSILFAIWKKKKPIPFSRSNFLGKILKIITETLLWNTPHTMLFPSFAIFGFSLGISFYWLPEFTLAGVINLIFAVLFTYICIRTIILAFYIPYILRSETIRNENMIEMQNLSQFLPLSLKKSNSSSGSE